MATTGKYGKIHFTLADIAFIKSNFKTMTNKHIAVALGLKMTTVRTKAYELGLQKMALEYWPTEAVTYLKNNYKSQGNREIVRYFTNHFPKEKGWKSSQIDKKLTQMGLKRNIQDQYIIKERNRQNGSFGNPNPKLKRKPMPKVYFQLDKKTRIELKPGSSLETLKEKYQSRNL